MSKGRSDVDRTGLIDAEHRQRPPQPEEDGHAQGQVEDLIVAEQSAQSCEKLVVDGGVVVGEALGVLDRKAIRILASSRSSAGRMLSW
jgi:hypothetical protein